MLKSVSCLGVVQGAVVARILEKIPNTSSLLKRPLLKRPARINFLKGCNRARNGTLMPAEGMIWRSLQLSSRPPSKHGATSSNSGKRQCEQSHLLLLNSILRRWAKSFSEFDHFSTVLPTPLGALGGSQAKATSTMEDVKHHLFFFKAKHSMSH